MVVKFEDYNFEIHESSEVVLKLSDSSDISIYIDKMFSEAIKGDVYVIVFHYIFTDKKFHYFYRDYESALKNFNLIYYELKRN